MRRRPALLAGRETSPILSAALQASTVGRESRLHHYAKASVFASSSVA
jgi:hypothetical protein